MNEDPMRDMVPPEDKSIRNIRINREGSEEESSDADKEAATPRREVYEPPRRSSRSKFSTWWIWALGVILVVFIILSLTPFLTRASIDVTPRHQAVEIDGEFHAVSINFPSEEADLFYETINVEVTDSKDIEASGEEEVSERAQGRITVFNEFSTEPERLIANTRFESESGLIFRISDPIVIPGYTERDGNIVPGAIEVTVTADEGGEEYNVEAGKWSVPGLEGDERFDKIYAESSSAMTGGFIGVKKVADESDVDEAREELRASLEERAVQEITSKIPEDFVFFVEASEKAFESLPTKDSTDGKITITERMLVSVPVFSQGDLAEFIAAQTIGSYDGEEVKLLDSGSLDVRILSQEEDSSINLSMKGAPTIVWVVDYDDLKEDLLGIEKKEVESVLSKYQSINEADINLSPFWKRTLPEEEEKLSVEEVISNVERE